MKKIIQITSLAILITVTLLYLPYYGFAFYEKSVHLEMGIPTDNNPGDDYLMIKAQYALSYNKFRNTANWVSWDLNADWYGSVPRYKGKFITDTTLPKDFTLIKNNDYNYSGFDRGHMVRSEERTKTVEDNKATFLLTNILPQTPDLNRGPWLKLEDFCENLCKKENKELYIVAGGIFHSANKIKNIIAIPDSCFKIIVILNKGQGLRNVTSNTQVIAVAMPNTMGIRNNDWEMYLTTVRKIEGSTLYNFLSDVPFKIQQVIENRVWIDTFRQNKK